MTSFIILSNNPQTRQDYIDKFCHDRDIDIYDRTIIAKETAVKQNIQSIGIEEIKLMQKKLFLKPIKSPVKAVILQEAQLLTVEAQNAMLKILEEPPENTLILLSADSKDSLLPTIISRCQIIQLQQDKTELTHEEAEGLEIYIEMLPKMKIGDHLKKAETLAKNKDETIIWIEKLILVTRNKLLNSYSSYFYLNLLKSLQQTHKLLKTTNANPRMLLEHTFISLNS